MIPVPKDLTREHFGLALEIFHLKEDPWTHQMLSDMYGFPGSTGYSTEEVLWAACVLRKLYMPDLPSKPGNFTMSKISIIFSGDGNISGFKWI